MLEMSKPNKLAITLMSLFGRISQNLHELCGITGHQSNFVYIFIGRNSD